MKARLILLTIGILMIVLSFRITANAQEPDATQEADQTSAIVVSGDNAPQALPPADVVVLQPEIVQPNQEKDTIAGVIEKITVPIIAIAGFIMVMLSSKNREKVKGVSEVIEDISWATTLSVTELVTALGGNPNIIVSTDPKVLAAALKTGDKHILIRHGVKFDDVLKEYNAPV